MAAYVRARDLAEQTLLDSASAPEHDPVCVCYDTTRLACTTGLDDRRERHDHACSSSTREWCAATVVMLAPARAPLASSVATSGRWFPSAVAVAPRVTLDACIARCVVQRLWLLCFSPSVESTSARERAGASFEARASCIVCGYDGGVGSGVGVPCHAMPCYLSPTPVNSGRVCRLRFRGCTSRLMRVVSSMRRSV